MGKRGPKPLPTNLKKQRGTYRVDRVPKNELVLPLGTPQAPDWLNEEARAEWDFVVPALMKVRVLSEHDRAMLADYCSAHALAVEATRAYQEDGLMLKLKGARGQKMMARKHPLIKVAQEARAQARQLGAEFGLSPSSRTRIATRPDDPGDKKDETESFLFDGKPKLVPAAR